MKKSFLFGFSLLFLMQSPFGYSQTLIQPNLVKTFGTGCNDVTKVGLSIQDDKIINLYFTDLSVKVPNVNVMNDNHIFKVENKDRNFIYRRCVLYIDLKTIEPIGKEVYFRKFNPTVQFLGDISLTKSSESRMTVDLHVEFGEDREEFPQYYGIGSWTSPADIHFERFDMNSIRLYKAVELFSTDATIVLAVDLLAKRQNVNGVFSLLSAPSAQIDLGVELDIY